MDCPQVTLLSVFSRLITLYLASPPPIETASPGSVQSQSIPRRPIVERCVASSLSIKSASRNEAAGFGLFLVIRKMPDLTRLLVVGFWRNPLGPSSGGMGTYSIQRSLGPYT